MGQSQDRRISPSMLRLDILQQLTRRPELFTPGERLFWDDPHISRRMLAAHLDPTREAASRTPEVIDAEVTWLTSRLDLRPGDAVLDLGCGPGLYSSRFAAHELRVTGIDYSRRSIAYAREAATGCALDIHYRLQDYLTLDERDAYEAIFLIYGDLCALCDADRDILLARVYQALKPSGYFAFDATTPVTLEREPARRNWMLTEDGFWRSGLHLVLEERFIYPEESVSLDQYVVVEQDGRYTVYRLWLRQYTLDTLRPLLERHGFQPLEFTANLRGEPYTPDSPWLGVVVQKPRNSR